MLVAAQGMARLLSLDNDENSEQRQLLDRMAQAIQKADSLVRRLAGLGRTLREIPRLEPVALSEIVRDTAVEVRLTKGIPPASLVVPPDLPTIHTDRERLRQVLLQVLRNAHQASRGELPVLIRVEWQADRGELCVIDNGRGLPSRPIETLLQPFHPANPGQGLGLFTAHTLLVSLGGGLTLENSTEQGATVRLRFPPVIPEPPGA